LTGLRDAYFEVLNINNIKSNNSGKESDVRFRDVLPEVIRSFGSREMFLDSVETVEKRRHSLLVCILRGCETRLIDPVINIVVRPIVRSLNLLLQILWKEDDISVFLLNQIIKLLSRSSVQPSPKFIRREQHKPPYRTSE
jgi:hypothetical protein